MLQNELMLKNNELCLVGKAHSHAVENESGLYARDTRFLSELDLTLGDLELELLTTQQLSGSELRIVSTNMRPYGDMQPHEVLVTIDLALTSTLEVSIHVENFSRYPLDAVMNLVAASDFRDMFDVRGMTPPERIAPQEPGIEPGDATLRARASDGIELRTHIRWSGDAIAVATPADDASRITLTDHVQLAHSQARDLRVTIQPQPSDAPVVATPSDDPYHLYTTAQPYATGDSELDRFLNQCDADLALLQTSFPQGVIPAAGVPWFICPFGRDSMITSLQAMRRYPYRAQEALRVLAGLQGREYNTFKEEQPGKIPHEMRYGEMARLGQVPHAPYYGSIDSTPLFLMTLAACDDTLPDDAFFAEMRPHAERAFAWIETDGDLDGDGLIEFAGKQQDNTHISQQGWKDSFDSLHFADGREVSGPIALVEPQAYIYAAYAGYSRALERRGEDGSAYAAKAERIRDAIETQFWLEDAGFYAQALDGNKQPVDAISSNAGHVLFCGVASQEHADRVAERFARPDMNGGWGIRTLSADMATYNPMAYHNGSVWPHDVSLAMKGLHHYGHQDQAATIARQLVKLASYDPRYRLAELYSGFADTGNGPVPYPVSCSPQAWAAGAGMLIAQVLGVEPTETPA